MRVLHLLCTNQYSGAENVACQIIAATTENSEIEAFYCSPEGPIRDILEERNIRFVPISHLSPKNIRKIIKQERIDVLHAHDYRASVLAAMQRKVPVIAHLHNNPPWLKSVNINSILFALTLPIYKKVYGVSQSVYDEYIFRKFYRDKFETLPNVVDKTKVEVLASEQMSNQTIDLLFVGRLELPKQPLEFLHIVKAVGDTIPIHAVILGDGELRRDCEDFIKKNHLEDRVALHGFVDNPYKYMKRAKLLIMPSLFEGFGLVAVESMLLGTPVICSGAGGLVDIVDSQTGAICNDTQEYVSVITELLTNEQRRNDLSKAAQKKAKQYTDIRKYAQTLQSEYELLRENEK